MQLGAWLVPVLAKLESLIQATRRRVLRCQLQSDPAQSQAPRVCDEPLHDAIGHSSATRRWRDIHADDLAPMANRRPGLAQDGADANQIFFTERADRGVVRRRQASRVSVEGEG